MKRMRFSAIWIVLMIFACSLTAAEAESANHCVWEFNVGRSGYFCVKTGNSDSAELVMLRLIPEVLPGGNAVSERAAGYGAYQVKVSCWDEDDRTWETEQDYFVINKPSDIVALNKPDTYYRIRAYFCSDNTAFCDYPE